MPARSSCPIAIRTVRLAACLVFILSGVSGIAISNETPEEAMVDSLSVSNSNSSVTGPEVLEPAEAGESLPPPPELSPQLLPQQQLPPQQLPAQQLPAQSQYLTNNGYIIPVESGAIRQQQHPISDGEISVYVAIGVLTLIAAGLIVAGAVFCYKYSAALRASESAQPIILGWTDGGGCPEGDDKLARHAHKTYYQRQKQNITAAFKDKSCFSKSSIAEEDSDQDDPNVYGYQGMASTSGLEVNNPMFKGAISDED